MTSEHWRPSAPIDNLRRRAEILGRIRSFFAHRDVMEVDTQQLSHRAVSDPFIDSIEAQFRPTPESPAQSLYLQTSPEYAMKRLLAAGAGAIYQLGKVFRNGEVGGRHNPEFTMLEWYRPGLDDFALMDEVEALVAAVLPGFAPERLSYRTLFERELGIDPHRASLTQLQAVCRNHLDADFEDDSRDTWLNLLMSHVIEPRLEGGVFVHDFPASQSALARVREDATGTRVAARFELFIDGMEIANGYHELTDSAEQARRLEADQRCRSELGLPQRPLETRLVASLEAGLPECAGVALGVDRLVMLALGTRSIRDVIAFPFDLA
ncbi:elongation factor P--(R)-beta-lysine ligase [Marinobacterium nitratireducens]|uniref:Elongation factor P--(R)-beta-lysine ligase n=1 Tax=Marinobacterium nitratireducens TaxID=518897 RepID=A0A917ZAB2_9GAMM|nr:EF-P lysine aminoacylase EpmA [Marinobacterium nitratireducens]GGO78728.1 elongation factor P--(R)-beta-lysine ligase [Marinobacterium nitratireducens]